MSWSRSQTPFCQLRSSPSIICDGEHLITKSLIGSVCIDVSHALVTITITLSCLLIFVVGATKLTWHALTTWRASPTSFLCACRKRGGASSTLHYRARVRTLKLALSG